jgi:hypothetical protein
MVIELFIPVGDYDSSTTLCYHIQSTVISFKPRTLKYSDLFFGMIAVDGNKYMSAGNKQTDEVSK